MGPRTVALFIALGSTFVTAFVACGSTGAPAEFIDTPSAPSAPVPPPGSFSDQEASCVGLKCQQVDCDGGVTTTVTGTITAPNGTLPLYNAIVYVPTAPLDPIPDGVSCDRCGSVSGKPLVSTVSGVDGKFELTNVPAGNDIPLVIQIGKWRRQVKLPKVQACAVNALADTTLTHLPRNKAEGDIPRIAVTTGRCDQLACLLPKLGLDASEFTPDTGDGRLHLYRGAAHPVEAPIPAPAPTGTEDATVLFGDPKRLDRYDMVLLSCECGEHQETKSPAAKQALYDFASAGGRVFASHYHYAWAEGTPLASTAQWMGSETNPENPAGPYLVDTSFPKGDALAKWLVAVGASTTPGQIPISQARDDVGAVVAPTQRWVYRNGADPTVPEPTMYLGANTPVAAPLDQQCGKFVFADMHLYGGDIQDPAMALPDDGFPGTCSKDLTPEEKALAFLFFHLASCIQCDPQPPVPPVH